MGLGVCYNAQRCIDTSGQKFTVLKGGVILLVPLDVCWGSGHIRGLFNRGLLTTLVHRRVLTTLVLLSFSWVLHGLPCKKELSCGGRPDVDRPVLLP